MASKINVIGEVGPLELETPLDVLFLTSFCLIFFWAGESWAAHPEPEAVDRETMDANPGIQHCKSHPNTASDTGWMQLKWTIPIVRSICQPKINRDWWICVPKKYIWKFRILCTSNFEILNNNQTNNVAPDCLAAIDRAKAVSPRKYPRALDGPVCWGERLLLT